MPAPAENITAGRDGYKARHARAPSIAIEQESLLSVRESNWRNNRMILDRPIGVAGAGSIGCFVGGMLAAAGRRVKVLARPRAIQEIKDNGLRLTSFEGLERNVAANQLTLSEDASIFGDVGVVLVTVKSADSADMAEIIVKYAPPDAVIVSLQNGVGNVSVLRQRLAGRRVLAGMVPFNVIPAGAGRFHRSTSGDIVIEQDAAGTAAQLSVPGLKMRATSDIAGVQWGKLLVNLNNALNALSDLPLRQQLAQRAWRRLFAAQMAEGLLAVRAEGIRPVSSTPVPAGWTPHLLRLPDAIFGALLASTMKIEPEARSSMWEDLKRGRRTEIDYLQGVISEIADRHGLQVPLSRRIVALIGDAEAAGQGPPGLTPEQIWP
jgi:2-dehydropantoate 2-reductase